MSEKIKVIDVHSHFILPCYLEALDAMGVDPVKEDGFPTPLWSEDAHLSFMEQVGIDFCILSLSTPHVHYGDNQFAAKTCRNINEETAQICQRHPKQLAFSACIPLPDIQSSISEVAYAYDTLGAIGIKVPSNSNGVYLGDPCLDPVFAELNRRKAVITIHPSRPPCVPEHQFTSGPAPLFEYIADTTRAVLNLIAHGTLNKFPDLKVIVPHSGSFLPLVVHRMMGISKILIPKGLMEPANVLQDVSKLYFDVAGDTLPVALEALLKITDSSHIMYGSDFPYTPIPSIQQKKQELMDNSSIYPFRHKIFHQNAMELFGMDL